jgi:hypothetical protein
VVKVGERSAPPAREIVHCGAWPWAKALNGILDAAAFVRYREAAEATDARPQDRANRCEFIVGSYCLFESLLGLADRIDPLRV